jgi:hypothetical protein
MAKKKTTKKSTKRKSPIVKEKVRTRSKIANKDKEPEYMVQVHEPTNLRKNILESLREIIIFMQSYEKFRQIQEEKVNTFNDLKESIKQLTSLLDRKLKHHFPKGKLSISTIRRDVPKMAIPPKMENEDGSEDVEAPARKAAYVPEPHPITELDELESQLRDIEGQLRKIS